MANRIDLDGKIAVVTGGAQGIGYAIAQRLQESGAKLILWDREPSFLEEARRTLGPEGQAVEIVTCDVADWASVQAAAKQSLEAFGRVDILVNNAGISGLNTTVADYPIEEWRRVIDIDLTGVFYGCKALFRRWSRRITAGSSMSPRSPARKAIQTPPPIPRRKPA